MFNRGSKGSAVAAVITDNEYKLVLNAIFEARDRHGRTTNITYLMTWFRTNKTVAVDVYPQGYTNLGTGHGTFESTNDVGEAGGR